ncbi:hypothetical protein CDG81_12410 [Actinopolyspora erythraea]|uniref:DUF485 domain-containing protein n=1 Tax=Actinopolyspora erythraea TaxID=414996 RepID=A0A099D5H1_9ACTN|nr:hypothetical protein [Actinopolyspora erythraea]ASU78954.1 hypothetical protein CDG81_12410 [Actinopolyspora erythraea]KGI81289.1 hypothetical protein IL38_12490 [Actinopolyspora erythraea]
MRRYVPPDTRMKVSSRTARRIMLACVVLCALSGAVVVLYLATPYVTGRIGSPQLLLAWLFCTLVFGIQIYNWRSIQQRALRREAERTND